MEFLLSRRTLYHWASTVAPQNALVTLTGSGGRQLTAKPEPSVLTIDDTQAPGFITLQGQKVLGLGTMHPSWQQPSSSIQNRSNRKKVRSELFRCQRKKMSLSENFCRLSFFWRIGRKLGFYLDSSFGIDSICIRYRFDPREKNRYCSCQPIFGSRGGFGFRAFRRHTHKTKKNVSDKEWFDLVAFVGMERK